MGSLPNDDHMTMNNNDHYEGIDTTKNVLQKHVDFFDRNKDGIIYPSETFHGLSLTLLSRWGVLADCLFEKWFDLGVLSGFRAIGCGIFLSSFAAVFINVGLSAKTTAGKFSLRFPIVVKNIQKAKHGSDTGAYDSDGRFVPSKFEAIFSKHAVTNSCSLTSDELMGMVKGNRDPKDYAGWLASYVEWKILYVLCKDKNGLLGKETMKAVYDGSLFEKMAKEKAST